MKMLSLETKNTLETRLGVNETLHMTMNLAGLYTFPNLP